MVRIHKEVNGNVELRKLMADDKFSKGAELVESVFIYLKVVL